ncbi:MAG: hypothetical protein ABEI99_03970 [Halobaculum sp.]
MRTEQTESFGSAILALGRAVSRVLVNVGTGVVAAIVGLLWVGLLASSVAAPFTETYYLSAVLASDTVAVFGYYAGITALGTAVGSVLWNDARGWFEKARSVQPGDPTAAVFFWFSVAVSHSLVVGLGGALATFFQQVGVPMVSALVVVGVPAVDTLASRSRLSSVPIVVGIVLVLPVASPLYVAALLQNPRSPDAARDAVEAVFGSLVAATDAVSGSDRIEPNP